MGMNSKALEGKEQAARFNWELHVVHKLKIAPLDVIWLDKSYTDRGKTFTVKGLLGDRVRTVLVTNGAKFMTRKPEFVAAKMAAAK